MFCDKKEIIINLLQINLNYPEISSLLFYDIYPTIAVNIANICNRTIIKPVKGRMNIFKPNIFFFII